MIEGEGEVGRGWRSGDGVAGWAGVAPQFGEVGLVAFGQSGVDESGERQERERRDTQQQPGQPAAIEVVYPAAGLY